MGSSSKVIMAIEGGQRPIEEHYYSKKKEMLIRK